MYVQVSVHERDLTAVYELLVARAPGTAAAAMDALVESSRSPGESSSHDGTAEPELKVLNDVTEEGRAVAVTIAKRPGARMFYEDLEAKSGVSNAGAALQSISIRSAQHGLPSLIEKRRDSKRKKNLYSMNARTAAIVLKFVGDEVEGD